MSVINASTLMSKDVTVRIPLDIQSSYVSHGGFGAGRSRRCSVR